MHRDRGLRRAHRKVFCHLLTGEHLLDVRQTPRNRRDTAEHDACATTDCAVHLEDNRRAHDGMRPRLAIGHLEVPAASRGLRRRELDRRQHLVVCKNVLRRGVLPRQHEEVRRRDTPLIRGSDDAERGAKRYECRGRVRWMDDIALSTAEDGVELVLTREREALVAAVLVAGERVAVIPAPRTLCNVPRKRAHVADLRRRHAGRGLGENRIVLPDDLVPAQRVERHQAADGHARGRSGDLVQVLFGFYRVSLLT
ncbi:MAG: hypothetical protein QM736_27760, partial [Vicinamibacterales bacterium]